MHIARALAALAILGFWTASSHAQAPETAFELPQEPAKWINSRPLSIEGLKGKGVFLWFYEETCPKCRAMWPGFRNLSEQYKAQPIVFIAVNSGTPRQMVEQYVNQYLTSQRINWPVIVDTDRSFEKQANVAEISLQNIHIAMIVTPEGKLQQAKWGSPEEIEASVKTALQGAAWKIDPMGMPEQLVAAWRAIEMGNYSAAGATVKKSLTAQQPAVKAAAEKLNAYVQPKIAADIAAVRAAYKEHNTVEAFLLVSQIGIKYAGFDLPPEVENMKSFLIKDPKIKAANLAIKALPQARTQITSDKPLVKKRAVELLEKIVKDAPNTDYAKEAQALLTQHGGQSANTPMAPPPGTTP